MGDKVIHSVCFNKPPMKYQPLTVAVLLIDWTAASTLSPGNLSFMFWPRTVIGVGLLMSSVIDASGDLPSGC